MKISQLDDEFFWESMQDHGEWEPRDDRLVSKRDQHISVIRDRRMYYRNIEIGIYTDKKYAELLRFESDPEVQKKLCIQYKTLLSFASRAVQLSAVRQDWWAIGLIKNPSEAVQLAAVQRNGYAIQHIKEPSEAIQIAAVRQNGCAIQFIKNPSETVQLAAVRQNILAILYIENPSEAVRRAAQQ